MIKILNDCVQLVIDHLNAKYPQDKKVYLHIVEGYDVIEGPDGTRGFGVFVVPQTSDDVPMIYIPGEEPMGEWELVIESISHEYKHFMQWCSGEDFDEEAAEAFAWKVAKEICKE